MPNPYQGNDDAAEYLQYFASAAMERNATRRLYDEGVRRRKDAQRKAEAEMYPRPAVSPLLTRERMDDFLVRAKDFADRRQRKLVTLEQQLYGHQELHFDAAKLEAHVKHMYDDQLKRWRRRETRNAEIRGDQPKSPRAMQARDLNRLREAQWKPVATSPPHDDAKRTLVHRSPVRASSAGGSARRAVTVQEKKEHEMYLARLSKPLRKTEKLPAKPRDGFTVFV